MALRPILILVHTSTGYYCSSLINTERGYMPHTINTARKRPKQTWSGLSYLFSQAMSPVARTKKRLDCAIDESV